ncbi:MAG: Spy/CpxP family protein refolding chaperone [Acidobacteria bacterium]|nr:Spy/CpxP family protein refolding chaperone [Acidobacteriota bacterium]
MKRWIWIGAVAMLGLLSLGAVARIQSADRGPAMRERFGHRGEARMMSLLDNERIRAALGLTDEQSNRLRQILVESQKSSLKLRADLGVRRIELRELMRVEKPDRDAVMKKVQEISDLRGQMMKQRVDSLLASKTILTPEQQQKIRSFMHRGGREGFGGRRSFERRPPRDPMGPGGPAAPPSPGESPNE